MYVMPAQNSCGFLHYLAGRFPGKLAWLMSPGGFKEPRFWLPYALDNGRFSTWASGKEWSETNFFKLLDRAALCSIKPMWLAVPDAVGNREETLSLWRKYERRLRRYRWPLAFVVQDGMLPSDIPTSADVIFVGGTTKWKWSNAAMFSSQFPRVHIGRVNSITKLEYCQAIGAESCDGTGFFRGGPDSRQARQLADFVSRG